MDGATFSSDEVNFLIYRYMLENGFTHTAFTFGCESNVTNSTIDGSMVPRGALISIIQKGVNFTEAEFFAALASADSVDARLYESNLSTMSLLESVLPDGERMKALERKIVEELGDAVAAQKPPHLHIVHPPRPTSEVSALSSQSSSDVESFDGVEEENDEGGGATSAIAGSSAATPAAAVTSAAPLASTAPTLAADAMDIQQPTASASTAANFGAHAAGTASAASGAYELNGLISGYESGQRAAAGASAADAAGGRFYANGSSSVAGHSGKLKASAAAAHTRMNGTNARGECVEKTVMHNNKLLPQRQDRTIDVDLELDRQRVLTLHGHQADVFVCSWSSHHDAPLIASGSADHTARIWRPPIEGAWSSSGGGGISSIELDHGKSLDKVSDDRTVTCIDWSADGTQLATGCYDGVARVWSREGDRICELPAAKTGPIFALKWNPSGTRLLSACSNGSTIVWDPRNAQTDKFDFHEQSALDVDWINDETFVSSSCDRSIYLCQHGYNQPIKRFEGHASEINAIRYDKNSARFASCSDDRTLKVWSLQEDKPVFDVVAHEREIYTLRWSPRGWLVASASFDTSTRIWDVEKQTCTRALLKHTEPVYGLAFSPDARCIASGSFDQTVHVWDLNTGKVVLTYTGTSGIFEVDWNQRGDRLAASGANGKVLLFDLRFLRGVLK